MKQQAMRVVAVDEDGVAQVRRLSWLERFFYHLSYGVGWLAARIFRR
jgi:hypothetical protein